MDNVYLKINEMVLLATKYGKHVILFVAEHGCGKTRILKQLSENSNYKYINVNRVVSESLIDKSKDEYVSVILPLLRNLSGNDQVIILDNIELLFDSQLKQKVSNLLLALAQNQILIVSIPGKIVNNIVYFSESGHQDYQTLDLKDFLVVDGNILGERI